jgi:Zn-finger nucleic acid-binding protein
MNCVACNEPMIVLELDEIEIDYCLECGGVWLDSGELELLIGDASEVNKLMAQAVSEAEVMRSDRKCPICRKRMEAALIGADTKVEIDRCVNNDGLWFDRGELREILEMMHGEKSEKVVALLKDVFGTNSTKEIGR